MREIKDLDAEAKKRKIWFDYQGHEILLDDYTNVFPDQFASLIERMTELTFESGKKDILLIVNVTGAYANKEAVNAFAESGKKSRPLLKKTAVVGITGVKKILLNVINKFSGVSAKAVSSMEEAKKWLISN
ncbi:MAG: hypothetical protein ACFFCV_09195 [Promethearchaeota archaeon]